MPGTAEAADNRPSSFDAKAYAPDAPGHHLEASCSWLDSVQRERREDHWILSIKMKFDDLTLACMRGSIRIRHPQGQ